MTDPSLVAGHETEESLDKVVKAVAKEREFKAHQGIVHLFPKSTVEAYIKTLEEQLPYGLESCKDGLYGGKNSKETNTLETTYMVIEKKKGRGLYHDESQPVSIELNIAEKAGNLVAVLNHETGEFEPKSYLAQSLHKKNPSEPDHAIIGVVGKNAKKYGTKLYETIMNKVVNSKLQDDFLNL